MSKTLHHAFLLLLGATLLSACSTTTVRVVDRTPPVQRDIEVSDEQLLDVGVVVFDANIPESYDEQEADNIVVEVRRAEGNYIAFFTKNLLQSTGNWGAVRVVPSKTHAVDVVVTGVIHHSDGERMILEVAVRDARGVLWFEETYMTLASKYAYEPSVEVDVDPFQATYRRIADDMYAVLETLSDDEIRQIRTTAEMQFARDFSPDAFADYVAQTKSGTYEIKRLPTDDDPMLDRVRKVREREYLFIDTLDEYFDDFHKNMYPSYQNWREASYDEAIAYRRARDKARRKILIGTAAAMSGVVAQASDQNTIRYGGLASIAGGAGLFLSSFKNRSDAKLHAEVLRELGASAEAEIMPHTIELENRTLRLQGTVDEQYGKLRRVLRDIYFREMGWAVPDDGTEGPDADKISDADALQEDVTPQ